MKKEFWIILICTILIVITLGYGLFWMYSHVQALSTNGFVYVAGLYVERTGSPISCRCDFADPRKVGFRFDDKNFTFDEIEYERRYDPVYDLNVSEIFQNITIENYK